jgi:hypothetical protein
MDLTLIDLNIRDQLDVDLRGHYHPQVHNSSSIISEAPAGIQMPLMGLQVRSSYWVRSGCIWIMRDHAGQELFANFPGASRDRFLGPLQGGLEDQPDGFLSPVPSGVRRQSERFGSTP